MQQMKGFRASGAACSGQVERAIVRGSLVAHCSSLVGRVTPCAPVLANGHLAAGKGLPALPDYRVSIPARRTSGMVPRNSVPSRRSSSVISRTSGVPRRSSVLPPLTSGAERRRLILPRRNFGFSTWISINQSQTNRL